MNRSLLAALAALSLNASADEWRYWTWTGEARMGAATGRTAWFATSGGVLEWDLDANTTRLHQRNEGLPSTDLVSIASQSDGSVWTVSSRGDLAVKHPDESMWRTMGTYSAAPSPWTFAPRAMAMHKSSRTGREVLVMGGPKGLTFFATDSGRSLDWTDQFSTLGKREVRSLLLSNDTLWVGLMGGIARIVPPWDSIGNNRAFVADPRRWTLVAQSAQTDAYDALYPTAAGVVWQPSFTFGAKGILLNQGELWWKGRPFYRTGLPVKVWDDLPYPVHALDLGTELLVSSENTTTDFKPFSKGPLVLSADGTFREPPLPSNHFPAPPPPLSRIEPNGRILAWSNNTIATWNRSRSAWESPWKGAFRSTIVAFKTNFLTADGDQTTLVSGPGQSVWVGSWGQGLWGTLPPTDPDSDSLEWKQWTPSNSCLEGFKPGEPNYPVINAMTSTDSSVWGVLKSENDATDSIQIFEVSLHRDPSCWKFQGSVGSLHSGLLLQDRRLWVAAATTGSAAGVLTVLNQPQRNTKVATRVFRRFGDFRRVAAATIDGQSMVLALTPSSVVAFPANTIKDTLLANSLTQPGAISPRQKWRTMAIDALGQIWAAGSEGIDILSLQFVDSAWAFRLVREVTMEDGLPSNNILSLSLDLTTGAALVSTDAGLGLWSSPYRPLPSTLETGKARVWPNPLLTRSHRELVVDGATAGADFYLHAADGSLVLHLKADQQTGGYFRWSIPAPSQLRPGVYRWTLKDGKQKVGGPLLIAE